MVRLLDGVKVFELGIAIAAPAAGRLLAYHGAEVYKVESPTSPEILRLMGSAWLRENEDLAAAVPDSSPYLSEMNAGKKGVGLDLKSASGNAVAKQLIAECDVFLANYGARALAELGLDYASVRAINPDIVYVQLPGFGTDPEAPYYSYVAWGPNQAPLVGIDDFTGHADREPAGIATIAPPDYLSSQHAAFCVLTALEQRHHTGKGIHLDIAQFETTVSLLFGPFVMEHDLSGVSQSRIGNRSLWYAPEGVYPCQGNERWIAISVDGEDAWQALLSIGPPAWATDVRFTGDPETDGRFATNRARMANAEELDAVIGAWTAGWNNVDLAARLQQVGVAAHIVATNEDLLQDDHLMQQQWYQAKPSARFTRDLFGSHPVRLGKTPGRWERAAPSTGEHTVEVLTDVLGMTAEQVAALIDEGAAFPMDRPAVTVDRPYEPWLHVLFPQSAGDSRDLDQDRGETQTGNDEQAQAGQAPTERATQVEQTPAGHALAERTASTDPTGFDGSPGSALAEMDQPFAGLRVIDLSGLVGAYATRLLAALGAEVIKIEPPGGSPLRRMAPFVDGAPEHEGSLWWAYLAMGTRSVVIDVDDPDQHCRLAELLESADIVVDDRGPDDLHDLGIGYQQIKNRNPGVVWIAITPFGRTGPKRGWTSSNLVAWAASGVLYTVGFDDQPPVVPAGPAQMGLFTTSLHAATGAILGLRGRRLTGVGQLVDLSLADSCLALSPEVGLPVFLDDQVHRVRAGNRRTISRPFGIYPCSDGYVSILVLMPRHWEAMAGWVNEVCGNESITDPVFGDMAVRGQTMELIDGWVEELTTSMTLLEFFQEGQRRGIPITPVNTISSLRADPHLAAVDFWEKTELPSGGTATIPGPPFRTDRGWWQTNRAPRLGEHTNSTLDA